MKLISHRGNIVGSKPNKENSPSYIDICISCGYEVEVDIRYINEKFYLGHDNPVYEINEEWINKRKEFLWIHCKNLEASTKLFELEIKTFNKYQYFCHSLDSYVLTSTNHLWVHDLNLKLNDKCIIPLLSDKDIDEYNKSIVYAICTDYISFAKYNLKEKGLYK